MKDLETPSHLVDEVFRLSGNSPDPGVIVNFAGTKIAFFTCCPLTLQGLNRLFHHIVGREGFDFALSIVCSNCLHGFPSKVSWDWDKVSRGEAAGLAWFTGGWNFLSAADSSRKRGIVLARGLAPREFSRREVLRIILQPFLDLHGIICLHGATIGRDGRGVLLSNRGGSGKSTLVAQGIRMGLETTGDDFLLLKPRDFENGSGRIFSYFSNLKIHRKGPGARGLDVEPSLSTDDEKGLIWIARLNTRALAPSHVIEAVVIPLVGKRTCLKSASLRDGLDAILPSSIHLSGSPALLTNSVQQILKSLPVYSMSVGPDPQEGLEKTMSLLGR